MSAVIPHPHRSIEAYLAWEEGQVERHEFWRGEVFAMVGATQAHNLVVANLVRHLGNGLEGSPCRVLTSTMKLRIDIADAVLYPDVMVSCSAVDRAAQPMWTEPTLIVEVLSPSTAGHDRGDKFAMYRRVATLVEYVLIDPDTRRVDGFRRSADAAWKVVEFIDGEPIEFQSVGVVLARDQVFAALDA